MTPFDLYAVKVRVNYVGGGGVYFSIFLSIYKKRKNYNWNELSITYSFKQWRSQLQRQKTMDNYWWNGENNCAARAARTLVDFFDVPAKRQREISIFKVLTTTCDYTTETLSSSLFYYIRRFCQSICSVSCQQYRVQARTGMMAK